MQGRTDHGTPRSQGSDTRAKRAKNDPDEWLRDAQYPADPERLEETARRNRAPQEILAGIRSLPQRTYPDMADVRRTWGNDPAAGQTSTRPSGTRHG